MISTHLCRCNYFSIPWPLSWFSLSLFRKQNLMAQSGRQPQHVIGLVNIVYSCGCRRSEIVADHLFSAIDSLLCFTGHTFFHMYLFLLVGGCRPCSFYVVISLLSRCWAHIIHLLVACLLMLYIFKANYTEYVQNIASDLVKLLAVPNVSVSWTVFVKPLGEGGGGGVKSTDMFKQATVHTELTAKCLRNVHAAPLKFGKGSSIPSYCL